MIAEFDREFEKLDDFRIKLRENMDNEKEKYRQKFNQMKEKYDKEGVEIIEGKDTKPK